MTEARSLSAFLMWNDTASSYQLPQPITLAYSNMPHNTNHFIQVKISNTFAILMTAIRLASSVIIGRLFFRPSPYVCVFDSLCAVTGVSVTVVRVHGAVTSRDPFIVLYWRCCQTIQQSANTWHTLAQPLVAYPQQPTDQIPTNQSTVKLGLHSRDLSRLGRTQYLQTGSVLKEPHIVHEKEGKVATRRI